MNKLFLRLTGFVFLLLPFSFLILPLAARAGVAHRYHTSLTRIDYNSSEELAEITIQTFADDLESALRRVDGKRVNLERTPDIDKIILNYLSDKFILKNKEGEIKTFKWVGLEQKTDAVWLYVETSMPEGLEDAMLDNRFLFEMFNDQTNLVTSHYNETKTDLAFKAGDKAQSLVKKAAN